MIRFFSKIFTAFMLVVCIGGIAYLGIKASAKRTNEESILAMGFMHSPDINGVINRLKVENVFVNGVLQRQELITMEVDLESELVYDDSWSEDLFKKAQKLVYFGTGKYSTDLNIIDKDDIVFDHDEKKVSVTICTPQISSVEIDELHTLVNPTENGLFRFGELKLPATEFNRITLEAKNKMREEMSGEKLMEMALINTEDSVRALYKSFLEASGFGYYNVEILWKQEM